MAQAQQTNSSSATFSKVIVLTESSFSAMLRALTPSPHVVVDLETTGLDALTDRVLGVGLCVDETTGYYIPIGRCTKGQGLDERWVLKQLKPLLEQKEIIGHNLKFETKFFKVRGIELKLGFDTELAHYLLDENTKKHGLKALGQRLLGVPDWSIDIEHAQERSLEEIAHYCIEDVIRTYQLYQRFKPWIEGKFRFLYYGIELPLIRVLAQMELEGYPINAGYLLTLRKALQAQVRQEKKKVYAIAGKRFNVGSPVQLRQVLYEDLQLPIKVRTETGQPSTDKEALGYLQGQHPIIEPLLAYKRAQWKLHAALKLPLHPLTGRVHPEYHQAHVETGRLSCHKPNIHSVPKREKDIQRVYVVGPGRVLVKADYSAQEVRILAACTKERRLLGCFANGIDPHSDLAKQLFTLNCPIEEVKQRYPEQREQAKTIQYAIIYGAGPTSISQTLRITRGEAWRHVRRYFAAYPRVKRHQQRIEDFARARGYVVDVVGRRRHVRQLRGVQQINNPRLHSLLRQAVNFTIQSTGAAIIKLAMIRCHQFFQQACPDVHLLASRHDEIQFSVPEAKQNWAIPHIQRIMESVSRQIGLTVPMKVDIEVGRSWGDLEAWPGNGQVSQENGDNCAT
jgi:DNA polymerase-1